MPDNCEVVGCVRPAETVVEHTEWEHVDYDMCGQHAEERTEEYDDLEVAEE